MFLMLSCFDLRPEFSLYDFERALDEYMDHMRGLDLVENRNPVGLRQTDTSMDTNDERGQQYFMLMHFRDRAQCDAATAYIQRNEEPVATIHRAVSAKVDNMIFICWQDVARTAGQRTIARKSVNEIVI